MQIDRTDALILRLLQKDGRLMNKQLAAAVGLAPSSCHERVKRLHAGRVITGTRAGVDAHSLGYHLSAVVFAKISRQGQADIDRVMDRLIAGPEIQRVQLITGRYDLVVSLITRDMNHLKTVAHGVFSAMDEILSYETSVSYDERRDFTVVPTDDGAGPAGRRQSETP